MTFWPPAWPRPGCSPPADPRLPDRPGGRCAEGDYGPFKMGLQSYSLRGFTTDGHADLKKALAATNELGLHYWEAFPAHVPMTDDRREIRRSRTRSRPPACM